MLVVQDDVWGIGVMLLGGGALAAGAIMDKSDE